MCTIRFLNTGAVAGVMLFAQALIAAAPNNSSAVPPDYTWSASHKAAAAMQSISHDAHEIAADASTLQDGAAAPETEISRIQANAKNLDHQLRLLESLRNQIVPDGQAVISQAEPLVAQIVALTDSTRISAWRQNSPSFNSDLQKLESQARQLARKMRADTGLERKQNEQAYIDKNAPYLRKNLGMPDAFGK